MSDRLNQALVAIDEANADDPNRIEGEPRARLEGERADRWVVALNADAPEEVRLAARAHHLRRWEVPRDSYPEGRAGYLRWRRDQKRRHADQVAAILEPLGYSPSEIERVAQLLRREGLGHDAETQLVEDAACLTFLEIRLTDLMAAMNADLLVDVLSKTLRKMSPAAAEAATALEMPPGGAALLERAARAV